MNDKTQVYHYSKLELTTKRIDLTLNIVLEMKTITQYVWHSKRKCPLVWPHTLAKKDT